MEDYKEKYDDLLARLQRLRDAQPSVTRAAIDSQFPESAESEDEKILKTIKQIVGETEVSHVISIKGCDKHDVLAWLEKQGENTYNKELSELLHKVICRFINDPDIPYSDREKVSMKVLPYVERLEKQGEQKPVAPKFRVGDEIEPKNKCEGSLTVTKVTDKEYYSNDLLICEISEQDKWQLVEQKPADKVEPKFHEGDWVVSDDKYVHDDYRVCKITKIVDGRYYIEGGGFLSESSLASYEYRLWTIQDAKNGDVLSYVTDEEDLWIMIYWSLYEPYEGHVHYHALLVNNNFFDNGTCCICIDNLKPATKEQRDTLMKAMADAGYIFDFDKKELKKIEQKPAEWHREDEQNLNACLGFIPDAYLCRWLKDVIHVKYDKPAWSEEDEIWFKELELMALSFSNDDSYRKRFFDWLKSLKDKCLPQPKHKWSEEDRAMLDCVTSILCQDDKYEENERQVEWLKGIKDKAFPQLRQEWSSEDNEHIRSIISTIEYCRREDENAPACVEVYNADLDWLKSLRPQPKQYLSEDDEGIIATALSNTYSDDIATKLLNKINSLRPQKQWSEEQLREGLDKASAEWDVNASFSPIAMVMDGDRPTGTKQYVTSHADSFKAGVEWVINKLKALGKD